MSYNKELESDKNKKQTHDESQKKNAADRLKKEAAIRKQRKAGKLINLYYIRLAARTVGFHPTKRGSIPLCSTK